MRKYYKNNVVYIFVLLFLLLSSMSSFNNSFDVQTNQIIELDNKEDDLVGENDKDTPIDYIPISNKNDNFILYFEITFFSLACPK